MSTMNNTPSEGTGTKCGERSGEGNKPMNRRDFPDKLVRVAEAIQSMGKIDDESSGKSVISRKYTPVEVHDLNRGQRAVYKFANGFGASVINSGMAYGGLELAVLGADGRINYETPVTDDVEGNLDADKLDILLAQIEALTL